MITDVRPLDPARAAEIRTLLVSEAGQTTREADRPLVGRRGAVGTRTLRWATAGVSVAAATAVGLVLSGVLPGIGGHAGPKAAPPAIAAGLGLGSLPASTASGDCTAPAFVDPGEADGLRYLVAGNLPAPIELNQAWATGGTCTTAWPARTLIGLNAAGTVLDHALTVWGPDAAVPYFLAADDHRSVIALGDTTALFRDFGWGAFISWSDANGNWVVTGSGLSADVVRGVAAAVHTAGPSAQIQALLPGLDEVALPDRPKASLDWYADYSSTHGTAADDSDRSQLSLDVSRSAVPWQARTSTDRLDGWELVTVNGQLAALGHNGPDTDVLQWQIAPGVQAQLFGRADIAGGGLPALVPRLEQVTADDPRVVQHPLSETPSGASAES